MRAGHSLARPFPRLTTPGTYTVWLRGCAPNGAGDSLYLAFNHQPVMTATGFSPRSWNWTNQSLSARPLTVTMTQPGLQHLRLWMRKDGLRLDKLLLTRDPLYQPLGVGPLESAME